MDDAHKFSNGLARIRTDAFIEHAKLSSLQERAAIYCSYRANMLDSGVADATFRHVDDALGGDVVRRIHDQVQICHHVADLGAIEEACASYETIRHTRAQQHIFEHTTLRVRAIEDRHLVVGGAVTMLVLDLSSDPPTFVALIGGGEHHDLLALPLQR